MRGAPVQGGHPAFPENTQKFRHPESAQEVYGRHIERAGERFVGGNCPIELPVEILWRETVDVDRHIRQKSFRQYLTLLKQSTVQERFQDAAGASWRADYVHLASRTFMIGIGVPDVSQCLACAHILHDSREIVYSCLGELVVPLVDYCLRLPLQMDVDCGADPFAGRGFPVIFSQMMRFLRQCHRFIWKRLVAGEDKVQ